MDWGATAQDVIDSALMLELRAGIDVLLADLNRAIEGFVASADATAAPLLSRARCCNMPFQYRSG